MQHYNPRLVTTDDGSATLYIAELNESYHSMHGAMQESKHVFINAGLLHQARAQTTLNVLEVGFGTGLNALLTCLEAKKNPMLSIEYIGLEPFPIANELVAALDYPEKTEVTDARLYFEAMHFCSANERLQLLPNFYFTKAVQRLEDYTLPQGQTDLVYYDAFAPNKQAEIWQAACLQKTADGLAVGGALVTYCARGQFRRDLKSAGLHVEVLAGALGKKEMTRAVKI
jgi:tRNA U34 5-methylaminomethyl-2-thiouridine-forming methyltransferase MnmC